MLAPRDLFLATSWSLLDSWLIIISNAHVKVRWTYGAVGKRWWNDDETMINALAIRRSVSLVASRFKRWGNWFARCWVPARSHHSLEYAPVYLPHLSCCDYKMSGVLYWHLGRSGLSETCCALFLLSFFFCSSAWSDYRTQSNAGAIVAAIAGRNENYFVLNERWGRDPVSDTSNDRVSEIFSQKRGLSLEHNEKDTVQRCFTIQVWTNNDCLWDFLPESERSWGSWLKSNGKRIGSIRREDLKRSGFQWSSNTSFSEFQYNGYTPASSLRAPFRTDSAYRMSEWAADIT